MFHLCDKHEQMDWKVKAEELFNQGVSVTEAAKQLGVSKASVSRFFKTLKEKPDPIPESVARLREKYTPKETKGILKNDFLLVAIVLSAMGSISVIVTAPILISSIHGVHPGWCYVISGFVDVAPILFILRGRHIFGGVFSFTTGLQVAIACNAFSADHWTEILKALIIAISVGLATYGVSDMIKNNYNVHN